MLWSVLDVVEENVGVQKQYFYGISIPQLTQGSDDCVCLLFMAVEEAGVIAAIWHGECEILPSTLSNHGAISVVNVEAIYNALNNDD